MIAAYVSAENGQWRYDIGADTWALLPSGRPRPVVSPPYDGGTGWAIVGHQVYALLEDGKLYRATFDPAPDLVWEGPLLGGWSFLDLPRTFYARAYQIAQVFDQVWIYGVNHTILVYEPETDALVETLTVPSPLAAAHVTNVALVWDHDALVYAIEYADTGAHAVYAYDLRNGAWSPVGDGAGPDSLHPLDALWFDGQLTTMNFVGTLSRYDPVAAIWTTVDLSSHFPFGAYLDRIDPETLLLFGPVVGGAWGVGTWTADGTFTAKTPAPTAPDNQALAFFGLYLPPPVIPLPLTVFPTEVAVAKQFEMAQVPRVRGAVAVESTYQTPTAMFGGILSTDADTDMRALIESILEWLQGGPIVVEILPGRVCTAYVHEHTLDPKWVGVNDTLINFTFSLRVPDTLFYDFEGYGYHTP